MSIISSSCSDALLPEISNSLRFNGTSSYLSRTFSTPSNQDVWTLSLWVKRSSFDAITCIVGKTGTGGIGFDASNKLVFYNNAGGVGATSTAVYRDPSAHYHLVFKHDGTTVRGYVNNAEAISWAVTGWAINSAVLTYIGVFGNGYYYKGYISSICFIDGQALNPSSFAHTDPNGQWRSLSKAALTALASAGGTNSFFLPFDDGASTTTLGNDVSSKNNDWTLNSMVRDGSVNDCWSYDTPTNNFTTLSSIVRTVATISNGALTTVGSNTAAYFGLTANDILTNFYLEITNPDHPPADGRVQFGFRSPTLAHNFSTNGGGNSANWIGVDITNFNLKLYRVVDGAVTSLTYTWQATDVLRIAFDASLKRMYVGINANWYGNDFSTSASINTAKPFVDLVAAGASDWVMHTSTFAGTPLYLNFGQCPVSGGTWDAASGGYFRYAPPSGYKALCTKNLPVLTGAAVNPKEHFDVSTRTGTGAVYSKTGLSFSPDLVWVKDRTSGTYDHGIFDRVRGAGVWLRPNSTALESTDTTKLTTFDASGYTLGAQAVVNTLNDAYVDWLWKAGGAAVTNNAGSIASQVSANTASGFSIVTYIGTGANATVGHGLGVAPKMVIAKGRTGVARDWLVWHSTLLGTEYLRLSGTTTKETAATVWNSTTPSSTVFSLGSDVTINTNTNTYVAYCFAEVPGFSKIGAYGGNGSADGPFVYCGFRPKFVMVKGITEAGFNWEIFDTSRIPYNDGLATGIKLEANAASAEPGITGNNIDIVANGFKLRTADWGMNKPSNTYIFIAFAEAPFKYANAR